ncbi:hypothetical protein O6H91_Y389900 [Diphasiastrum complanatum]|nr:hypothetical protein O6H91_Y389900 [Diphasiastrum complanatum]
MACFNFPLVITVVGMTLFGTLWNVAVADARYSDFTPPTAYAPDINYEPRVQQFLLPQNEARATVGLPSFVWDTELQNYAQWWANQRARYGNCLLKHSGGPYGENIFWGYGKSWTPADAVAAWVDEKYSYNYQSNTCAFNQDCGHYTQIVWRDSCRVGCARVTCANGAVFMTCNYDPPGNYIGERPY